MDEFRDIVVPAPVSAAPQTWAWYPLFGALLVATVLLVRWFVRHRRATRYRRLALAELEEIRTRQAWGELPALVKRVALQAWPRERVAALTGTEWIEFLGGGGFARLYDGDAATADVVRDWIRTHHA